MNQSTRCAAVAATTVCIIGIAGTAFGSEHTVQSGETLSGIAESHSTSWRDVYAANRDVISDPDLIYPGQVLTIGANETTTSVAPSSDASLPITDNYTLTARYGQAGSHWASGYHTGLDFAAPVGTPIRVVAPGEVATVEWHSAYGRVTTVNHGDGVESMYAHQSVTHVSPGQSVDAGQHIGSVGSTGNSTGPHLHLEIKVNGSQVAPGDWLRERSIHP